MAYKGERKLASICRISDITPIEGADRIEVAHIHGWKIVVGKNEFKVGDLVVYFEIDSYLPVEPRYEFLRDRCFRVFKQHEKVFREGFRIKTCKLRGVISQGLVMPLSAFPEITARIHHFSESEIWYKNHVQYADKDVFVTCTKEEYKELIQEDAKKYAAEHNGEKPTYCWEMYMIENNCELLEGANVTKLLNIDHYDEVAAPFMPVSIPCGDKLSDFPSYIPKSDEERVQNLTNPFVDYLNKDFEVTIKRDGSSLTAFYSPTYSPEQPFGVCSRNMRLKMPEGDKVSKFWDVIIKNGYDKKIIDYCKALGWELAFQGELIGPGIQGNRSLFKDFEWHIFRIWDIRFQRFVECSARRKLCEQIGLTHVPVVEESLKVFQKFKSVDEILEYADGKDDRGNMREGLVFKENGTTQPVTFKAVSNKYLLKQE